MTDLLLTITDLAARFHRDRRSIMAALSDIPPADQATVAGRVVRRWALADVEAVLTAPTVRERIAAAYERLHAARATILELKRGIRTGELLDIANVVREFDGRVLAARAACLALEMRLGSEIQFALQSGNPLPELRRIFDGAAREIIQDLRRPFSWSKR